MNISEAVKQYHEEREGYATHLVFIVRNEEVVQVSMLNAPYTMNVWLVDADSEETMRLQAGMFVMDGTLEDHLKAILDLARGIPQPE